MDTKFVVEEVLNPTIYSEVSEQYKSLHKGKDCIVLAEESEFGKMYYYLPLFSSEESLSNSQSEIESRLIENEVRYMNESLGDIRQKLMDNRREESSATPSYVDLSSSKSSCPTFAQKDADTTIAPEDCFADVKSVLNKKTWFKNACEVFPSNSRYLEYSSFPKSFKLSEDIYEGVGEADYSELMVATTYTKHCNENPMIIEEHVGKEKTPQSSNHNLKPELLDLVQLTSFIRTNFKDIIKDGEITTYGVKGEKGSLQDVIFVVDMKGNFINTQGTALKKFSLPNEPSLASHLADKDIGDFHDSSQEARFIKVSFSDTNLHRKNKQIVGFLEHSKSSGKTKSLTDVSNMQRDFVNEFKKVSMDVLKRESLCFNYTSSSLIKSSHKAEESGSSKVSVKSSKKYKRKKSKSKTDKSPKNTTHNSTDDSQDTSSASSETTSSDISSVSKSKSESRLNTRNCHICHKVKRSNHSRKSGIFDSVVKVFANYLLCTPSGITTRGHYHHRGS